MRSEDTQPHASNLPQTHLPGGAEPCRFPRYTIFYFWWGSWSLSVLTSLPPPPPAPSTPTAFAFFWPCHIPKRIRCLGKLAALRSKGVQADLILGAAVFTQDWRGRGEKEGSQGSLSSQPPLWALNGIGMHMLGWGTRDADLPAPTPLLTPHFISPSAAVSPIRHLISGKFQLATDPIMLREVPRGLRGPNADKCCPLPSGGPTWN